MGTINDYQGSTFFKFKIEKKYNKFSVDDLDSSIWYQ
jgi:hypothetical protein